MPLWGFCFNFATESETYKLYSEQKKVMEKKVYFKNTIWKVAGCLFLPEGFNEEDRYAAVILAHPGGGVKEQTSGIYAEGMAKAGLLDEVSLVLGAGIDGRKGMTAVFDGIGNQSFPTVLLKLNSVERIGENSVWMRYTFNSK